MNIDYLVELLVQLKNLAPAQYDAAQKIQHKAAEAVGHLFPKDLVLKNSIMGLEFKSIVADSIIQEVVFAQARNKLISILEAKIDFLKHDESQVADQQVTLANKLHESVLESQANLLAKIKFEKEQAVAKVNDLVKSLAKSNELISARNDRIAVLDTALIHCQNDVKRKRIIWMIGNFGFWALILTCFLGAVVFYYDRGKDVGKDVHDREVMALKDSLEAKKAELLLLNKRLGQSKQLEISKDSVFLTPKTKKE